MLTANTRIVNVVNDPDTGELILDLGNELCAELGWQEGDTLEWIDQGDGSWLLLNQSPMRISTPSTQ